MQVQIRRDARLQNEVGAAETLFVYLLFSCPFLGLLAVAPSAAICLLAFSREVIALNIFLCLLYLPFHLIENPYLDDYFYFQLQGARSSLTIF